MEKPLKPDQESRLETCRSGCQQYIRTPVLGTYAERCKACGCFIRLLALRGAKACAESRWT